MFNKPHGIHGELSFTFTDDAFDRTECPYLVCQIDGIFVPFFIEEYRFRGENSALLKLEDIDSDSDARPFTNTDVYFPKSYLEDDEEQTAPGDYFIGFEITDQAHGYLGKITHVDDSTINVLFVVNYNNKELLIPANEDFILNIDEDKKTIRTQIPEGLLQL